VKDVKAAAAVLAVVLGAVGAFYYARAKPAAPAADSSAERANLNFTLKDMNGNEVRLAELKGRPVLINFWATWCGPCKDEIPALIAVAEKYKAQNLAVIGISIDDTPEQLRQYAAEHKVGYPLLIGSGHDDLLEAFDAEFGIPVSWLIRADGTIVVKQPGGQTREWFEAQIKTLFTT